LHLTAMVFQLQNAALVNQIACVFDQSGAIKLFARLRCIVDDAERRLHMTRRHVFTTLIDKDGEFESTPNWTSVDRDAISVAVSRSSTARFPNSIEPTLIRVMVAQ
jgi:hypothetical protein